MKKWAALFSVLVALTGVLALFSTQKAQSSAAPVAFERAKVLVQEMKISEDTKRLLVPTKVEAKVASVVTAEVEGFVTKIVKPLGSKVKSGEVVLYVENRDPAFTYAKVPVRSPVAGVVSQMSPSVMSRVSRTNYLW